MSVYEAAYRYPLHCWVLLITFLMAQKWHQSDNSSCGAGSKKMWQRQTQSETKFCTNGKNGWMHSSIVAIGSMFYSGVKKKKKKKKFLPASAVTFCSGVTGNEDTVSKILLKRHIVGNICHFFCQETLTAQKNSHQMVSIAWQNDLRQKKLAWLCAKLT